MYEKKTDILLSKKSNLPFSCVFQGTDKVVQPFFKKSDDNKSRAFSNELCCNFVSRLSPCLCIALVHCILTFTLCCTIWSVFIQIGRRHTRGRKHRSLKPHPYIGILNWSMCAFWFLTGCVRIKKSKKFASACSL